MTAKELLNLYIAKYLSDPNSRERVDRINQAQNEALGIDTQITDEYRSAYLADAFGGLEDF
tara:strand:+ start:344 stop:526 length:183 start_codon:yes stop_codon:yes gene_type:complete